MRKSTFCIGENKSADQLRSTRDADQRLYFRFTNITNHLLSKPKVIFCACTDRFVSDRFGNHIAAWFSHEADHM